MSSPSSLSARVVFGGQVSAPYRRAGLTEALCTQSLVSLETLVSPPGSPEALQDGGCKGSASVWFWMLCKS